MIRKTDIDATFWHIRINGQIESTSILIVENISLLCLCINFGTTPAPAEYTAVSKAAIDLGDDLLRDKLWDAKEIK